MSQTTLWGGSVSIFMNSGMRSCALLMPAASLKARSLARISLPMRPTSSIVQLVPSTPLHSSTTPSKPLAMSRMAKAMNRQWPAESMKAVASRKPRARAALSCVELDPPCR